MRSVAELSRTFDRNITKITVKKIYSLLLTIYNINLTGSKIRKPDFVTRLENEITRDPGRYDRYIANLNAANDTAVQQAENEGQPVTAE